MLDGYDGFCIGTFFFSAANFDSEVFSTLPPDKKLILSLYSLNKLRGLELDADHFEARGLTRYISTDSK